MNNPTIAAPPQECCWHTDPTVISVTSGGAAQPSIHQICCWHGERRTISFFSTRTGHGPHITHLTHSPNFGIQYQEW